jgi:hypothetical protein
MPPRAYLDFTSSYILAQQSTYLFPYPRLSFWGMNLHIPFKLDFEKLENF